MDHDVSLIATVAMGFVLAFVFGFAANRINLPPLVGYLMAGIAVGPFTPGFIADVDMASQLAEIGVILLMFGVGVHFSAADLLAVRWIAIPGALGRIVIATLMGMGIASLWGWSLGAGLVLGLCLSVASTVVVLRALEDRNALSTSNGRIAVGWLVVEDLAMVLALVLLPAFAEMLGGHADPSGSGNIWLTLAVTLGKVAAFVALAMALGPKVLPWLLKQVARTGSRELFTLSVLAVALGIAYGSAELFGVSFALGAFFAGVVMSESDFGHRAAGDSLPLQDAFAILFFVSVGMLFDPSVLIRDPLAVLAVLLVIMVGKSLAGIALVLALGYPPATALVVSGALAQIGEFSFILAGLGIGLGLMPPEGRDLVLAGSILSITLSPLVFAAADRLVVAARNDPRWAAWFDSYGQRHIVKLRADLDAVRKRQEARAEERSLRIEQLVERFPLFRGLDRQAREDLLLLFRPRSASPGERIIRAGERGDTAFFLASGAVQVTAPGLKVRLEAGEFFGEMALLSGKPRTADVTAIDYCNLLALEQRDFRLFMGRHPWLRARLAELSKQRVEATARTEEAKEREVVEPRG